MLFEREKITLLDGAMGTMLQRAGAAGGCNELLNLTRPEVVRAVHRAYVEAGSEILYANTFGASPRRLRGSGHSCAEVIRAGLKLAREAAGGRARVALDVGPLGALLEPLGTLRFEDAYEELAEIMRAGAEADLIVIETMTDLQEARAALLAAKEQTGLPVAVTMSFEERGRTFTGTAAASMARVLEGLGADAVGVNCSLGPAELLPIVREIRRHTRLPVIVKPNAGLPDPDDGHYSMDAQAFGEAMKPLLAEAAAVGGCCGTDPAFIAELRRQTEGLAPAESAFEPLPFVCTATRPLALNRVAAIGERINPTGKKRFQQALLENDMDWIVRVAVQEEDAGAEILDVNVGMPGIDEAAMLPRVVKAVQAAVDLPLQLDSTDPAALEAALRVYCGKAVINSVNGKAESLRTILPLARKYGAAVVALALDEAGLPETAGDRFRIVERIVREAERVGIPREDVWADCLTLTVSAQQSQAEETLRALGMVCGRLGLQTVLGVSNISFGLPNRPLMTAAFLLRALSAGLTLPIVNPNQPEVMDALAAFRVLNGDDEHCAAYIARFAGSAQPAAPNPAATQKGPTLREAILRGLRAEAAGLARAALETVPGMALVEQELIPALDEVGEAYEGGRVFLPQLLSAAQAAQGVFEEIRLRVLQTGEERPSLGKIVLATVQGDIHDIGKNIVKTVLENYGFTVIDLGRDVPPEAVVRAVREEQAGMAGLSALMTTTLPAMAETVRLLKAEVPGCAVMVGGAVVTAAWAASIGADYYAKDAREAAETARRVFTAR